MTNSKLQPLRDMPVLVLMGNQPLRVTTALRALKLLIEGKAYPLKETDRIALSGDRFNPRSVRIPTVIVLGKHHNIQRRLTWKRPVVFERDSVRMPDGSTRIQCKYCGTLMHKHEATVDHIHPRKFFKNKSEANFWENTCASCKTCQKKKGDKTLAEAKMSFIPGFRPVAPRRDFTMRWPMMRDEWREFLKEG